MRVLVVGAGVIGLTVGVRLSEAGYDVDILARDLPLETTSAVAAAIWYPHLAGPADRVRRWSEPSLQRFRELAETEAGCGVVMRVGTEVLRTRTEMPWWATLVTGWRRVEPAEPSYADAWTFTTPVVEMPTYLSWLQRRLAELGATITRMALSALPHSADLVVNCSGLGSRLLAGDESVAPVRGQVLRVEQIGLERWLLDGDGVTYIVPRSNDIVIGGTETPGVWDRRPDPRQSAEIWARATRLVPELRGARTLGHRVGLRPVRPTVRLEEERVGDSHRLIHCYGHGGSGVTISWGCADEVLRLVRTS